MFVKNSLKKLLPKKVIELKKKGYTHLLISSLNAALKEQNLETQYSKLKTIVPDLCHQYSQFEVNTPYLEKKVRALHSFQIALVNRAFELLNLNNKKDLTIVDIGDSSGTHIQYLKKIAKNIRALSVNLDQTAIEKIRQKGLEAIHARAEELEKYDVTEDLFMSFEMLEHLFDPIGFLHSIAENSSCKGFVITVPYLAKSRIGLHHIRQKNRKEIYAENTHIFEFCPEEWKLIFRHSGWKIAYEKIYFQYPKKGFLSFTKGFWKKYDFEGFWGVILTRDASWSRLYQSW
jgi:2-polyprenyl-3-methyl-5-hydroxy-6-metoxy-1,4-benzoquinol methylase